MKRASALMAAAATVVATLSVLTGAAVAAPALDQSQTAANDLQPIPGNPSFPDYRVAQTFTAGITGTLTQIDLLLSPQFNPGDLVVEIRSVSDAVPTTTILAAETIPESSVPGGGVSTWVSIPLNVQVASTAGTQYAVVVHAPFGFCGADCWRWWGAVDNPYAGGAALFALDGSTWVGNAADLDFAFKTYVSPNLPSSAEECKGGGWQAFPAFKSQGDCVSFVQTGK